MILALLATLGAIVTAFVLYPVFTEAPATGAVELDESARTRSDLSDKKAMLYEAIQDLDFEKASGKISDSEHETLRNDYLAQVSVVIEEMDRLAPPTPPAAKKLPAEPEKSTDEGEPETATNEHEHETSTDALVCSSCSAHNPRGSNFCLECGAAFALQCASCGESLPAKARFCNACGEKASA